MTLTELQQRALLALLGEAGAPNVLDGIAAALMTISALQARHVSIAANHVRDIQAWR